MISFLCLALLQYSAVDTSPLSKYVMHPFWNAVVKVDSFCKLQKNVYLTSSLFTDLSRMGCSKPPDLCWFFIHSRKLGDIGLL